jgi:glycosyltransferase involved in cell wall biosynthesis
MPSVLIVVENLPVPLDRRVWQEATALARAGYTVSVICPKGGKYSSSYEQRDGIHIFRHRLPIEGMGVFGYFLEYGCAFVAEFFLACKVYRRIGFDVIQACNPPDNIFIIGCFFRLFFGTKFVFDHHDPFADLFAVKFPRRKWLGKLPLLAERCSLRFADQVITTSEELRLMAMARCGVEANRIRLVRSGFNRNLIGEVSADPTLKRGKTYLAVYIGVMGSQDGIDLLLQAISAIVQEYGRSDIHFVLAGGGTQLPSARALSAKLGLTGYVEFPGYIEGEAFYRLLASADIGLCPDPKNEFNDKLSMNKLLEYMAFGLPVAQFDLNENRRLAGDAAVYATNNDPRNLAEAMLSLLDNPQLRAEKGALGRQRLQGQFDWNTQEKAYLEIYNRLLPIEK